MLLNIIVINEFPIDRFCSKDPRNVILSWPQTTGRNHNIRPPHRVANGLLQPSTIVANDGLQLNVDPDLIKPRCQPKTISISLLRRQKFGANSDDLC